MDIVCFLQISKLTLGKEYQFRVAAENRLGCGDFVATDKVLIAFPFKVPGPPSTPQPVVVTKDHIIIKWNEPVNDGGNPIIAYHVEMKDRNSILWHKANKIDIHDTQFRAVGLQVGTYYHGMVRKDF